MLKKINYNDIYEAEHGFLNSRHHFSFAEYFDHKNMGFGDVRVVNDDLVKPFAGFPTHPHKNMEILSYVVKGHLTHKDSMGSDHIISQGEVQYMSAGTGVAHSEFNETNEDTRFFQIWLLPNVQDQEPNYGFIKLKESDKINKLCGVVNTDERNQFLNTNVRCYVTQVINGTVEVPISENELGYLVNIEGTSLINGETLNYGDALKFDENLTIEATNAHIIILITK